MVKPKGLSKKTKNIPSPAPTAHPNLTTAPGDTERRILAAARKEFISKGLEGARMQAIAADAGVNKALLHYYYRSKEKLYRTVLQDTLESVWSRIQSHFQGHGPEDGLEPMVRTLVSTYVRTLAEHPEFPLFMLREMSSGGHTFHAVIKEVGMPLGDIPARMLRALQAEVAAGAAKPASPLHFFINIMGMCLATFVTRPVIERMAPLLGKSIVFGDAYLEERIHSIVDMAMNGIRIRRAG